MIWLLVFLAPISLLGHVGFWISFWNHGQATALPAWLLNRLSDTAMLAFGLIPLLCLAGLLSTQPVWYFCSLLYLVGMSGLALVGIPTCVVRRYYRTRPAALLETKRNFLRLEQPARETFQAASRLDRILLGVPGNQVFDLEINHKSVEIPQLPVELDGLRVCHLSDLHFTGRISQSFFNETIEHINDLEPDLIAITGDIVDNPDLQHWIPSTLASLRATHGVYAILGNHDCKTNLSTARSLLQAAGITWLGCRWEWLTIRDRDILIAGNELPWIAPAADLAGCPNKTDRPHTRLLLSHSPDQLPWARHHQFDLMLAGHTHGGQFCLPGFGPVVCPSRRPLDYAVGTIYESPTLMHVSRGLSAEVPLRLNCRPEVTCLQLRSPVAHSERGEMQILRDLEQVQETAVQANLLAATASPAFNACHT